MKKRILVIIPGFKHGGTNRSLYNLLSLIDKERYEIEIFGMSNKGYYQSLFNGNHKILEGNFWFSALMSNIREEKKLKMILYALVKVIAKLLSFLKIDFKKYAFEIEAKKKYLQNYDTIIAFQEGEATHFSSYLKSKNKIAWIHCNYAEYLKYLKIEAEKEIYSKFYKIVCVSDYTKSVFLDCIPESKGKLVAIHNALNTEEVIKLSKENILPEIFNKDVFKIISVGRIDKFKRFSEIPAIASELKDKGFLFKWFIIGGISHIEEEQKLVKNIKKYNVEDFIFYLGEVDNPYPYIAKSDLLVSTSLSEAFPYVIIEAKVLHIPVIVTDFGSAVECILDGVEGYIVPLDKIGEKINMLLSDFNSYNFIKTNLISFKPNNNLIIKKINKIFK